MAGRTNHSAKTGRFVSNATVRRHPGTTVQVASKSGKSSGTTNHSAKTGRFVSNATVRRHPSTTVQVTNKK